MSEWLAANPDLAFFLIVFIVGIFATTIIVVLIREYFYHKRKMKELEDIKDDDHARRWYRLARSQLRLMNKTNEVFERLLGLQGRMSEGEIKDLSASIVDEVTKTLILREQPMSHPSDKKMEIQ